MRALARPDSAREQTLRMPHNVTTDMGLALWRLAANAGAHRNLLRETPPSELADRYKNGTLPDIGLAAFLDQYGQRGAAEADVGMLRWADDPAPVFAAIANDLCVTDPGWTPLFMTAGGLVTETGSPVAHGPTVAREYGIPAVICVPDAGAQRRTQERAAVVPAALMQLQRLHAGARELFGNYRLTAGARAM
jgi:hypothetical protein